MQVAVYCRLSREDDDKQNENDESESIQNQKSILINYAVEKGWDIYGIYCDEDYSGIDSERPQFNKLLEDAENKKFDIVLCKSQSRFTRDMVIVEKYLHNKFIDWNIRFISLVDHVDTSDKGNKKSRQINGLVNEWYLEDLSESIRKVFDHKRKEGLHCGSFVCYGYNRDPNNKNKIIIDEDAADVVRLIFNLYEEGNGVCNIAKYLNEKGIPTPTSYKNEQGLNYKNPGKNSKHWSESTVARMLKNEVYIGNMVQGYNKKPSYKSKKMVTMKRADWIVVENTHEPIISKEQFCKVQNLFKSKTRVCKSGEVHIFASKLVCLDCGMKLYKCQNDRGYIFFSCKGSKPLYGSCTRHSIGYDNLKELVTERIKEKILKFYNFDDISDNLFVKKDNVNNLKSLLTKETRIKEEMETFNKAIKELYINKVSNKVSEEIFEDLNSSFLVDKSEKQKELDNIQKQILDIQEKDLNSKYLEKQKEEIINKYKNFKELGYDIVNSFIDYIEIGEKDKQTNSQDVVIHWNF